MNESKSYKSLTQKQIIKELKCLVAKQQQQINKLIEEIQILKNEKQINFNSVNTNKTREINKYSSQKEFQNRFQQKHQSSRISSNNVSVTNSKNSTNRAKFQIQNHYSEQILKQLKQTIKQFQSNTLKPMYVKYFYNLKSINEKQTGNEYKNSGFSLKEQNFQSLNNFCQYFSLFLNQIDQIMKHIDNLNQKNIQKQKVLKSKIRDQQKTLQQMMIEYEKNIVKSQSIETKLLTQIQRLKKFKQYEQYEQHQNYNNNKYQQNIQDV